MTLLDLGELYLLDELHSSAHLTYWRMGGSERRNNVDSRSDSHIRTRVTHLESY